MNKKGTLEWILYPMLNAAVLIATLLVLLNFGDNLELKTSEISSVTQQIAFNYDYVLSTSKILAEKTAQNCSSCSPAEIKSEFQRLAAEKESLFRYEGAGNFYGKIRSGDFQIIEKDGEQFAQIQNLFVEAQSGQNSIKREFSLEQKIE